MSRGRPSILSVTSLAARSVTGWPSCDSARKSSLTRSTAARKGSVCGAWPAPTPAVAARATRPGIRKRPASPASMSEMILRPTDRSGRPMNTSLIRGTLSPGPPYTLARGDPDAPLRSRGSLAAARSRYLRQLVGEIQGSIVNIVSLWPSRRNKLSPECSVALSPALGLTDGLHHELGGACACPISEQRGAGLLIGGPGHRSPSMPACWRTTNAGRSSSS